jgi:hypothetical protein
MNSVLQALRQKRLKWVESNRENGFDEGINRLLTELYPDNAHFIYELLQNAEDPEATIVEFELTDNSINFVHNGKRLFSPKDVESITSIGNSTKRDDATTIGKFGVGFKAVFAYTNTPEIHSGEFHFRIHDLVVPDTDNLISCAFDTKKTSFIFPFNNPKKPAQTAISEIRKGLIDLGDNTLLFLNHIREISYKFPSGENGFIQRLDHNNGHIEIKTQHPGQEESISHWLRFTKEIEVIDDDGKQKVCSIAIAYSLVEELDKKSNDKFWKIAPLKQGQVSIYFPAEKETSNLRFHIHAPFASTVARDSVRDCEANYKLRDGIADLIVESLSVIRDNGLLKLSFLGSLPNVKDPIPKFYRPIREKIIDAFQNEYLTPTKNKNYAPSNQLFKGPKEIVSVLNDEDLSFLSVHESVKWVENSKHETDLESFFLQSLMIEEWEWEQLSSSLEYILEDRTENEWIEWISSKDDKWLFRFYAILGQSIDEHYNSIDIKSLRIIRVQNAEGDQHLKPNEAFIPSSQEIIPTEDVNYVKQETYNKGGAERQQRFIMSFFKNIGVRQFDAKTIIDLKLKYYNNIHGFDFLRLKTNPAYFSDVGSFVSYWKENPDNASIFMNSSFLISEDRESYCYIKPSDLYLDTPYEKTGLSEIKNNTVWSGYKDNFKKSQLSDFISFLKATGVKHELQVIEVSTVENINQKHLRVDYNRPGVKWTNTVIDKDFTLLEIKWLEYSDVSDNLSRLIWNAVIKADRKASKALFRPNQQHPVREADSQLVCLLKDHEWVLTKFGDFRKPRDMRTDDLPTDFIYDNNNGLLTAIEFGENARKLSEEYQSKNNKAQEIGFKSAKRAAQWAELDKQGFSPDELLAKQKTIEQPEKSVPNPERRRTGIIERSENALTKESVRRERSIQPGITGVTAEAKAYLRAIYTNKNGEMVCQCCQLEMPFKVNDEYYFEAVQCIKEIDNQHIENRLALCPNCAAMYQYARQTSDSELKLSILENSAADDVPAVELPIVLRNKSETIRFVGAHWFDLKTIFEKNS